MAVPPEKGAQVNGAETLVPEKELSGISQKDDGENSGSVRTKDQYALDIACPARAGNECDQTWISVAISLVEQFERGGKIG